MSDRQASFIENLLKERDLSSLSAEQRAFLSAGRWHDCDTAVASRMISVLLELPKLDRNRFARSPRSSHSVARAEARVRYQQVEVENGRYALHLGGALRFFRVDRPTEGRWAGRLFLNETVGGRDRGRSIREHVERDTILRAIADDPMTARVRYGREIGSCGYCNRTLTDETSRVCGIGPDCARQHGVDRDAIVAELLEEAVS